MDNRGTGEAGWRWPAIHPEARKFAGIAGLACVLAAFFAWETLAWPLGLLVICICAFFRDPQRVTPQGDSLILAPADGLVTLINKVPPPPELVIDDGSGSPGLGNVPVTRISIFMSVFDVHINRAPIGGTDAGGARWEMGVPRPGGRSAEKRSAGGAASCSRPGRYPEGLRRMGHKPKAAQRSRWHAVTRRHALEPRDEGGATCYPRAVDIREA